LLPYWRHILSGPHAAVVVWRRPEDVARSLHRRNGFSVEFGHALWERYARDLLRHSTGLPIIFTRYDKLIDETGAWCLDVHAFLRGAGFELSSSFDREIEDFIEPSLRTARADVTVERAVAPIAELWELIESLEGVHLDFRTPALPRATEWGSAMLEGRRSLVRHAGATSAALADSLRRLEAAQMTARELRDELTEVMQSRAIRYTRPLRRARVLMRTAMRQATRD
jgi:hypothetical protein